MSDQYTETEKNDGTESCAAVAVVIHGGGSIIVSDCFVLTGLDLPGRTVGAHRGASRWSPAGGTPDTIF